jgi:hypothetical protein
MVIHPSAGPSANGPVLAASSSTTTNPRARPRPSTSDKRIAARRAGSTLAQGAQFIGACLLPRRSDAFRARHGKVTVTPCLVTEQMLIARQLVGHHPLLPISRLIV